jgi:predicted ribosomally synthesized peptide with SipW-like signal peptide
MEKLKKSVDENTKWLIVATIIGALIGGFVGSVTMAYFTDINNKEMLKIQENNERKFIAQGIYSEISQIEIDNQRGVNLVKSTVQNNTALPIPYILTSAYPQSGLFYVYGKDIFKFDGDLPKLLYEYYFNVLILEQDRQYLMNNYYGKDYSKLDPISQQTLNLFAGDYYSRTMRISELTPSIKQRLEKYL